MATLRVDVQTVGIERLANVLAAAGPKAPVAIRRALAHTGDKARTQVKRALVAQTGLKAKVIAKAIKVTRPNRDALRYVIRSRGGDISLKFFSPRETRKGVSHKSRHAPSPLAGSFTKGGRFPRRIAAKGLNGHVYRRTGKGRGPLALQDSGVIIPAEMVEGASRAAFFSTVERELPARLAHELYRILG